MKKKFVLTSTHRDVVRGIGGLEASFILLDIAEKKQLSVKELIELRDKKYPYKIFKIPNGPVITKYLSEMGKIGGKAKSERKTKANRKNAKKPRIRLKAGKLPEDFQPKNELERLGGYIGKVTFQTVKKGKKFRHHDLYYTAISMKEKTK